MFARENKHKKSFLFLVLFSDEKYQKSFKRVFRPLKKHSPCLGNANQRTACIGSFPRVHELVARAVRGKCVRHGAKHKSAILPLSTDSAIPRVRTYHTREPSRFVHALSARPLKVHGGREYSKCDDGMESAFLFCLLVVLGFLSCRGRRHRRPAW